jgi:AraC family chitin signaling transcriptional activator
MGSKRTSNNPTSMKLCRCISILAIILTLSSSTSAQEYKLLSYNNKQGLHSNLIKAIVQDSLGFIWIATDNGLERFNGKSFEQFLEELPSSYVKSFYTSNTGDFFAVTDMGVVKIVSKPDKPEFITLARGSSSHTDSLLFYPKCIYIDHQQNFWIADNNSMWILKEGELKKYTFSEKNHTLNFQRSFAIAENSAGELYVFSETGYAHKYNREEDKFVEQTDIPRFPSVDAALFIDKTRLLIASFDGVFVLDIDSSEKHTVRRIFTTDACKIERLNDSVYFIASWTNGVYKCIITENDIEVDRIPTINDIKINNLFIDTNENLWLSSDFGIVLAQNLSFNSLSQLLDMAFVQSVDIAPNNNVYCIAGAAYSIFERDGELESRMVYALPAEGHLIQVEASKFDPSVLYLATTNSRLIVLRNGKVERTLDLSEYGRVLFYLTMDLKGNLWACMDGCSGVVKISPNYRVELIGKAQGLESRGIVLNYDSMGNLYCGGVGDSTYLFRYDYDSEVFINMSTKLSFDHSEEMVVNDIAFVNEEIILATSEGVMQRKANNFELIDLGTFTKKSATSIASDSEGFVWFSTDAGLFKYKNGKYYIFRENDGLNTIVGSYRCLEIDTLDQVWFGTQTGLNYSAGVAEIKETKPPILTGILVDGQVISTQTKQLEINKPSFIQFEYISLEMPGGDIVYKTKLEGFSDVWSLEITENEVLLPKLPVGEYTFKVKARQHGNYNWSDACAVSFSVVPHWYQTWWAYLLYLITFSILIVLAIVTYNRRLIVQKKMLEHKVKARTKEISEKNKELEYLNTTKDKFFSIIAHDLRNPFLSIMGVTNVLSSEYTDLEEEEKQKLIDLVHSSTEKTYLLLENLLTWARSQTNTITFEPEPTSLTELVNEAIGISEAAAHSKNIRINCQIKDEIEIEVDKNMITTVLRNLIMNAVKYSYRDKSIIIEVEKEDGFAKVSVEDCGVGIEPQHCADLFKVSKKISFPGTEDEKGTGLGLILCKEFVSKHHGTIDVISEPGKGSTFWFKVPLQQRHTQ